jgi:hypothetical protein
MTVTPIAMPASHRRAGLDPPPRPLPPARPAGPPGTAPVGPAGRGPGRRSRQRPSRDVRDLARYATRLFCEVEAGWRPRQQLRALATSELYARLWSLPIRPGPPATVVRTWGTSTTVDCYEAVSLVRRPKRFSAIALQLVRRRSVWRVAEIARPEEGPLPPPPFPVTDGVRDSFDLVLGGE